MELVLYGEYITITERIDKIGELLAKGIYLYLQKQKELKKANDTCYNNINSKDSDPSRSSLGIAKTKN